MTPWEAMQWIGVVFFAIVLLAIGIVAVKAAIRPEQPKPDPTAGTDPFDMNTRKEDR